MACSWAADRSVVRVRLGRTEAGDVEWSEGAMELGGARLPRKRGICLVGVLPPPVHGMATVNARVAAALEEHGARCTVINLSGGRLSRSWGGHFVRLERVLWGLLKAVWWVRSWEVLYIGLCGGLGQVYDALFIGLARVCARCVYVHHHSFAYLDRRTTVTRFLMWLAGQDATHIVLCDVMAARLRRNYRSAGRIVVLSNAALVDAVHSETAVKRELRTVGFLGNISEDKGIDEFLAVLETMRDHNADVAGLVAGVFASDAVEQRVMSRMRGIPGAVYVGPKYGDAKARFYEMIDVLLFPTKYPNEAEPLTILEAQRQAVPVVAWERGCIRDIVSGQSGMVVGRQESFVERASAQLMAWLASPDELTKRSRSSYDGFCEMHDTWTRRYETLLRELSVGGVTGGCLAGDGEAGSGGSYAAEE